MKRVAAPDWAISPEKADTGLAYLQCLKDNIPVEKIFLDTKSFYVFGRSDGVDILLQHESISRQHALIGHHKTGSLVIMDLNSGNGTFVASTRLPPNYPTVLKEGVIITFGASTRKYVVNDTNEKKLQAQRLLKKQQQKRKEEQMQKEPEDMDAAMAQLYTDINSSLSHPTTTESEVEPVEQSTKKKSDTRRVSFSDDVVELKYEGAAVDDGEEEKKEDAEEAENKKAIAEEKEGDFLKKAHKLQDLDNVDDTNENKPTKKKRKPNPPTPQQRVRAMMMLKNLSKAEGLFDSLPPPSHSSSDPTSTTTSSSSSSPTPFSNSTTTPSSPPPSSLTTSTDSTDTKEANTISEPPISHNDNPTT